MAAAPDPDYPGNFQNIPQHINIIKSWFDDPAYGINARMGNLCEDELDDSPDMKDARIRIVFNGIPYEDGTGPVPANADIFFHKDYDLWRTGFYCGVPDTAAGLDWVGDQLTEMQNKYIPPFADPNSPFFDLNKYNAAHFFLTGATDGNPPFNSGCRWYCPTGATFMTGYNPCGNGPKSWYQSGVYYAWLAGMPGYYPDTPFGSIEACEPGYPGNDAKMFSIGELLHILTIDHPTSNYHLTLEERCTDIPAFVGNNPVTAHNIMDTKLPVEVDRCALTQCQLGRAHHFLYKNKPVYLRTPDNNFAWPPTQECSITDPDIIISSGDSITWNSPRNLRSNIIIEPGGKLTIKCDVGLPENARITVHPNGELTIDGARIFNNCADKRWDGIVVIGNKWQHQYKVNNYRYQGYLQIKNGATVENAVHGVRSFDPANPYNTGGGIVIATDAQLLNNIVGVNMTNYQNFSYLTGKPTGDISYFNNCRFTVNADFPGSISQFQAMVSLSQVAGIEFRGCRFSNEYPHAGLTYAGAKRFGIVASDAEFQVAGLSLCNSLPCNDYQRSRFYGFDAGIHTGKIGSIRPFRVTMTDFEDNARGINAYKVDNIYVADNTFKVGMDLPLGNGNDFTGITLYRCTGYKIEENSMEPTAGNIAGGAKTIGIFTLHSWNEPNEIYKNSFEGLDFGNLSNGRNKNISVPDIGLQYLCNGNASNVFDFAVPDEEGTGLGIAGNQGSSNLAAGNSFTPQSYDPLSEANFLNRESFINYFVPPAPVNYTSSTIGLSTAPFNECPSRLPTDREGKLSQNEKQQFEQDFASNTDAGVRTYSANMLARDYLIDSSGIDLAGARTWLSNKGGLESYFAIVDSWLQEDSTAIASQVLQNIPNIFNLQGEDSLEYQYFQSLKSLQINALDNDLDNEQLVSNHESTIRSIAEAGHYYASVQAQNLINSVKGLEYEPRMILPSTQQQGMLAPPPDNFNTTESETVFLDAIPNPAKSRTVFHYRLPETIETAQIIVTSMDGRTIKMIDVEGQIGLIEWDTKGVTEGIYIYRLITGHEVLQTKRLVIIK